MFIIMLFTFEFDGNCILIIYTMDFGLNFIQILDTIDFVLFSILYYTLWIFSRYEFGPQFNPNAIHYEFGPLILFLFYILWMLD